MQMLKTKGLDPAKFADPAYLDKFVDRFLAASDREAAAQNPNPLLDLFRQAGAGAVNVFA
jgi:hypothetical protein